MTNLIKTKEHNMGALYKKFTIKSDPKQTQFYLRIPSLYTGIEKDIEWWLFELLHVYEEELVDFDFRTGRMSRVRKEKVHVTSHNYKNFMKIYPNMIIEEEFTTITLNTYEEELFDNNTTTISCDIEDMRLEVSKGC